MELTHISVARRFRPCVSSYRQVLYAAHGSKWGPVWVTWTAFTVCHLQFHTIYIYIYIYIYSFAEVFWSGWVGFFTEKESRVNFDDTSLEVRLQLTNSISSPVRCVTQQRKSAVRIPASIFLKFNVFFVPSVFKNFSRLQNVHTWSGAHQTSYLTLILLTWRIWWARNNASNWQMGFN